MGMSTLGRLMNESHESLRVDFDVTCAETDALARLARQAPGVLGARQMGGGFGGCVLALVARDMAEDAARHVVEAYARETGIDTDGRICHIVDGAGEIVR
jgi:galactokinase